MRKTAVKNLPLYRFHLLEKFDDRVGHAVLSRDGGVSKPPYDSMNVRFGIGDRLEDVVKNRGIVCDALGLDIEKLVSAEQTHSKNVMVVEEPALAAQPADDDAGPDETEPAQREFYGVDAFVTGQSGRPLMIQVADCQAQLLYDPVRNVAAAVHAGWKGLAQDIAGETISG
jgi:copper oxidase (laccase) domain-containing protein